MKEILNCMMPFSAFVTPIVLFSDCQQVSCMAR